ncbi:MASE1 protein [Luteibacter rhizovicinus]|uniref:MASE1 protein n=1 Tax=Luteibacter rhizovicinus TaxID=242606 RepID=A0A4R3YIA0_9GAMM|nr:MASE1 domain-containing protein [Luteibacter rhizovicinus]TCV92077.1 MASE1 protein [Luteibacter rhizovicinus]
MEGANSNHVSWARMAAVAAAYAACYELARYFSFSHWILPAGLRLACLFLVPRRFWPALAIGETLPVVESAALHIPDFGVPWAFVASIPLIVVCMPIVAKIKQQADLYRDNGDLNMAMILAATVVCALLTAVLTCAALMVALATAPPGAWPEIAVVPYFFAYLLGAYLGALTLTPTVLALRERAARYERVTWSLVRTSPLAIEVVLGVTPALLAMAALASTSDGIMLQICRMAMVMPVLVLTLRHGWHGGAVAGMLASIAMASTSTVLLDPAMIHAQVVLAFAISGALMVGVPITRRARARAAGAGMTDASHR